MAYQASRRSLITLLAAAAHAQDGSGSPDITWHDAKKFTIEGMGWKETEAPYDRLPSKAKGMVRDVVWNLSRDSSGILVRFVADTNAIHARWTVTNKNLASATMTATSASGLDLYAADASGKPRWLGTGRPTKFPTNVEPLTGTILPGRREYRIYLPLRNAVSSLEIGIPANASIAAAPTRPAGRKPIVFYGTSITHGAAASRAGMTHPAILGRRFDREIINLGFAGNGKMEPEVTSLVAELDAAVYVIDCLPNLDAKQVRERAAACILQLRKARPDTPILLVEDRVYTDSWLSPPRRERNETNHAALREIYARDLKGKVAKLHYLRGDALLGDDGEGAIDGSHPTDLGFARQADAFAIPLAKILGR
jgi:hypothetical protein